MTRRYYVPASAVVTDYAVGMTVPLPDDEAAHAARVMRVKIGETLIVFDGLGTEAEAVVVDIGRRQCSVQIETVHLVPRLPDRHVTVMTCLPKPDRAKELVERLTELGVTKLIPLVADRTQREPTDALLGKLRRVVVEACKQSGRNTLMTIEDATGLDQAVSACEDSLRYIAHPSSDGERDVNGERQRPAMSRDSATLLVGPEGGFTDAEVDSCLAAGFVAWDFGERIYRVETAAVVGATLLIG